MALALTCVACAATEKAQQRDPMRCEVNPECAKNKGAYTDCTKQCVDDPASMDRCNSATVDQPKH